MQVLQASVRRLDDCLPANFPVAFVKIDVEGAEAAVLRGMSRTLRAWRPVVVFECMPGDLRNCHPPLQTSGLRVSCRADDLSAAAMSDEETVRLAGERHDLCFVASPY